ncbi:MFS general substrate transporter [Schizopora paradoxa]|uniref:MFS general substrate transporter n=1 Tax=Schizopora paradoxa TaxID=27342 RepID=A0A0H2RMP0_9AGAM|nr:MFS general substrate transporter [Schizopora paradoxa]
MSDAGSSGSERVHLVTFTAHDTDDARNWSTLKKVLVVAQVSLLTFTAGFGSPIFAPAELQLIERFRVNQATADSGLAVFVLGFSFGPLFCPMSEMYGRRLPFLISWPLLVVCTVPSAFSTSVPVIIVFRLFAGCFAACASNNGIGIITDMFDNSDVHARSKALAWLALTFCIGPCLALPVGFYVVAKAGPEFWVLRVFFFFTAALLPVVWLFPETHGPTILANRAKKMRKEGVIGARAAHEEHHVSWGQIIAVHILRPAKMLLREPIIQGSCIWMGIASAVVYLMFEVYPIIYLEQHGFSVAFTGLPFFSLVIGFVLGVGFLPILLKFVLPIPFPKFLQPSTVTSNSPEAIMKVSLIGCILMPISLFWMAWTSQPETHWAISAASGIPFAFSTLLVILTFVTYTSQTYSVYTNSASACNSFFRSIASAVLAIASHKIISSLGSNWGISLFGFLTFGLLPIPLIFLRYGQNMRAKSRFAQEASSIVEKTLEVASDNTSVERGDELEVEKRVSLTSSSEV